MLRAIQVFINKHSLDLKQPVSGVERGNQGSTSFIPKLSTCVHPRLRIKHSSAFKAESTRSLGSTEKGKRYADALGGRCRASVLKIVTVYSDSLTTIPKQPKLQGALRDRSCDEDLSS